jgi:malate dehydrogenase
MTVVTAADVEKANGLLVIATKDVITPLAADRAKELGVKIERAAQASARSARDLPKGAAARPTGPTSLVVKASELTALKPLPATQSGALYRRGASVPPMIRPDWPTNAASADPRPFAAVIGAGHVGAMTALRLAETSLFARIALVDIVPGLAEGLALDMWHSASLRGFTTRIEGSVELSTIMGADYVVVTAGKPRQPGMSRTDLTGVNAAIIEGVAEGIRQHAPSSVVVMVTNPLE